MEGEQLYWQTVELYSNPTFAPQNYAVGLLHPITLSPTDTTPQQSHSCLNLALLIHFVNKSAGFTSPLTFNKKTIHPFEVVKNLNKGIVLVAEKTPFLSTR